MLFWPYLVAVAVVVGYPDGWAVNRANVRVFYALHERGIYLGSPDIQAVVLNLVMLVPLGMLGALGWPWLRWWFWPTLALLASVSAETAQLVLARDPSAADIAANTTGAALGVVLTALLSRWWTAMRSRPDCASAPSRRNGRR